MATPTGIITGSGGPTAHNNCIATGTFTHDDTDPAVDPVWIHLGFVPKIVFVGNATDGSLWVWEEHMANSTSKLVDTSTLDAADGVTPIDGNGAGSIVTTGDTYLRENAVHISTGADPEDRIIGINLSGVCGCTISKTFHYCAMR